jgi:hypothetical protein
MILEEFINFIEGIGFKLDVPPPSNDKQAHLTPLTSHPSHILLS